MRIYVITYNNVGDTFYVKTTNGIGDGTEYHFKSGQQSDMDDCYPDSVSDNSDRNTNSVSGNETSNEDL